MVGTSQRNINKELGWPTLKIRRNYQKLVNMWKIIKGSAPDYLKQIIPAKQSSYNTRRSQHFIPQLRNIRTNRFLNSFFPSTIRLWNQLPSNIKEAESIHSFKSRLKKHLKFEKTESFYSYGDKRSNILHTRFRLGFTQLNFDLFKRTLAASPHCICGEKETYIHFFQECRLYDAIRTTMMATVNKYTNIHNNSKKKILDLMLYGSKCLTNEENIEIAHCVQEYIKSTERL